MYVHEYTFFFLEKVVTVLCIGEDVLKNFKQRNDMIYFCLFVCFAVPLSLQDLSFPTMDRTWVLAVKVPSLNHWTIREFLIFILEGSPWLPR